MDDRGLDLAARTPVWEALAELWLDVDLADWQIDHIARVLVSSPYSLDEVRTIHEYEVAPALWRNLASVAGVWTGFDREWLLARCGRNARRRDSRWYRFRTWLQRPLFRFFADDYWRRLTQRVGQLDRAASDTEAVTPP